MGVAVFPPNEKHVGWGSHGLPVIKQICGCAFRVPTQRKARWVGQPRKQQVPPLRSFFLTEKQASVGMTTERICLALSWRQIFFLNRGHNYIIGIDHFVEMNFSDLRKQFVGIEFR